MRYLLRSENGIALFLVLWVLTLLAVIVGEFCHAMRTEVNITRNFKEDTQSYYIATAGLNKAIAELVRSKFLPQQPMPSDFQEEQEIEWRVNADIPASPFAQGEYKVWIDNESGKVNINRAGAGLLRTMLSPFDLSEDEKDVIVDSILDWRDKDSLHRLNGAEDDYYRFFPEPYECKDDDFDCVEELLLVRGITRKVFYGGLKNMVTVYGDEEPKSKKKGKRQGVKPFNYNRININAASREMLAALPEMTDELVNQVIEYRNESDFETMSDLMTVVGSEVYTGIARYITLQISPYYTIKSFGKVKASQTRQGVLAVVKINTRPKKGHRVIKWRDGLEEAVLRTNLPGAG